MVSGDEQILRLDVSVYDILAVQVSNAFHDLLE